MQSFKNVFSSVILKQEMEDLFENDEIDSYRDFANSISKIYAKIGQSAKFLNDTDLVISKLEECYRKNMLEQTIQNVNDIAKVFFDGSYTYYNKKDIYLYTIENFIKLLKGSSKEKKRIIMLNIENRLNVIEHYKESEKFDDDIPF